MLLSSTSDCGLFYSILEVYRWFVLCSTALWRCIAGLCSVLQHVGSVSLFCGLFYKGSYQAHLGAFRCIQVHLGVFRCIQVYSVVSRCIQVYSGVFRCIQVYLGVFRCIQVYSGVSRCIQVYSGVFRCI